jgi:hypothetical protein
VYLVPPTGGLGDGPDPSEDVGSSEVTPAAATYHFRKNPWTDVLHLRDDIVPWVWGDSTGFGDCYPAPILGYVQDGTLYFATDGIDDTGCNYELLFDEVSLQTGQGSGIGTETGYTYDYLGTWWLTFASSEGEGTGTFQLQ